MSHQVTQSVRSLDVSTRNQLFGWDRRKCLLLVQQLVPCLPAEVKPTPQQSMPEERLRMRRRAAKVERTRLLPVRLQPCAGGLARCTIPSKMPSNSEPMRPAPPPAVAHAMTNVAMMAAANKMSAYSVVACPRERNRDGNVM